METDDLCVHFRSDSAEEALFSWLIDAGLKGERIRDLFVQFCERLNEEGIMVKRASITHSAIHPQVNAFMHIWRRGEGLVSNTNFLHTDIPGEGWFASPFFYMLSNNVDILHRPLGPESELDFPVLVEFRNAGMTDWYAQAFDFGWGFENKHLEHSAGVITSWATDRPGGFSEAEFSLLRRIIPVFGLAVKGIASFRTAQSLLETYIGRNTAGKVLSGQIRRGSVESINAVLMHADLRGFTSLSDVLPQEALIDMLDQYLECIATPIETAGGEILKFMGDGLLATFEMPVTDPREVQLICETALTVARQMISDVDAINDERAAAGEPVMELDIALHVGDVMYGNVGSETRLDFTVIGPAVNEVSRMEALCELLGSHLVASADFVGLSRGKATGLVSCGLHELRGVREPLELFCDRAPAAAEHARV
ncbi:adenylate/guanylate cyclase domain-containing protein [Sneathiella sp.]|uniref:adenylate/guanylate cyclase domain-containing protein n=1 Tax=Sneathiella sp. TaxID=1964365 RepID=UPI002FDFE510